MDIGVNIGLDMQLPPVIDRGGSGNSGNEGHSSDESETTRPAVTLSNKKPERFVRELERQEIRWFYKKTVQDKTWKALNGRDSLAIETAYRRIPATNTGSKQPPSPSNTIKVVVFGGLYSLAYNNELKKDALAFRLEAIYWKNDSLLLARGTWFLDTGGGELQPLDATYPEFVEKIEQQHLKVFANQRIPDVPIFFEKGVRPVLCEVMDAEEEKRMGTGMRVTWHSVTDIMFVNHSRQSRLRYLLKLQPAGVKLIRGYREEAKETDGPLPVGQLIFVIHGIGQKRQMNRIVLNTTCIREIADQLFRTKFTDVNHRPMFLPVDWRSSLNLDEDIIEAITPSFLQEVRYFFNESAMDLMYYTSPVYWSEITRGMADVLNRTYQLYLSNDPLFERRGGKVSLVAHSLGSVIAYDILTAYIPTDICATRVEHLFCFGSPLGVFLALRGLRGLRIIQPVAPTADRSFRLHNIYHPADPVAYRVEPLVCEKYASFRPLRIHSYNSLSFILYDLMKPETSERRTTKKSRSNSVAAATGLTKALSESDDSMNQSGIDSDDGLSKQTEIGKKYPSGSPTATKTSWGAAVLGRLPFSSRIATASPEVMPVMDDAQQQAKKNAKQDETNKKFDVAVEQATEAVENLSDPESLVAEAAGTTPPTRKRSTSVTLDPSEALPYRIDYTLRQGRMEISYWAALVSHVSYWSSHDTIMYLLTRLYGQPIGSPSDIKRAESPSKTT